MMAQSPHPLRPGLMFDRCKQLAALDDEWQAQRLRWLDWDREPQPIRFCSLAITISWFIVIWSLLYWLDAAALSPAAATASVLFLFSPRGKLFESAFLAYQRRRTELTLPSMT